MAKTGRPRKLPKDSTVVNVALSDDLVAGLDRWVEELRDSVPGGAGISRPDLMRDILAKALREHETGAKRAPKKR